MVPIHEQQYKIINLVPVRSFKSSRTTALSNPLLHNATFIHSFRLINSNYSSFIQRPFKIAYSEALPAEPRSNNVVSRPERNRAEWATGVRRRATGRPFQAVGPATEKAN